MRGYAFWRQIPASEHKAAPGAILLDGPNPYLGVHRDEYGPNGYVALEFDGPHLIERYYLPEGTELLEKPVA